MFEIMEMMWAFTPEEFRLIILGGVTLLIMLKIQDRNNDKKKSQ